MDTLNNISLSLGIELSGEQIKKFRVYLGELTEWNLRFNLTAIQTPEEIEVKHFADSLAVLKGLDLSCLKNGTRVIDIGTGAGFPGLPLKIVLPQIDLALLESTAKKTVFLSHVIERLSLENVTVLYGRAETLAATPGHRESYDIAVSRAVARLDTLSELCLPFCRIGGLFIAHKKDGIAAEIAATAGAARKLGGGAARIVPYNLPGMDDGRCLVVIPKVSPTPEQYPRRPGIPGKNPLK